VKRIVVMAVCVILALCIAAPMVLAQAGAPEDAGFTLEIQPGDFPGTCDFPVLLETSGKGKAIELPGKKKGVAEAFIFTSPGLDATLTNVNNPENQETYNITGSVTQTKLENGNVETVLTGRNLAIDPEAGFVIAVGNFSFVFDAKGNLVQPLSGEGQLIDVCEALA
jgi:hypothetical protein